MSLTNGIVAYLLTQPAVTDIVGDSIQPIPAPVEATLFPCIAYQVVSDITDYDISEPIGMAHARVLFSCLASFGPGSYLTAHSLGLAVKAAFSGYMGTLPGGPKVWFAEVVNVTDLFNPDALLSSTNVSVILTYEG
ncbi:MAG: hypothetical protein ABSF28_07835 [Terracidiphilus sp.]|jgi:hypothetical protein